MMRRHLSLLTAFIILILSLTVSPAQAQDNLLLNSSFEDERTTPVAVDPDAAGISFNAPVGWGGNVPPPSGQFADYPVGFPHRVFVRSGTFGFQMGRGGAVYTASLFQRVDNVLSGLEVQARAFVYVEGDVGRARLGIHPAGVTNPFDPGVVWTDFLTERNTWRELSVSTTATGTAVTVFLFATSDQPGNPNAAYWDDTGLFITGGTPVEPPPEQIAGGEAPVDGQAPVAAPGSPLPQPQPGTVINVVAPFTNLNVRAGAGLTFPIIGMLRPGDTAPLLGEVDNAWYEIDYDGQRAFVSSAFADILQQRVTAPVAPAAPAQTGPASTGENPAPAAPAGPVLPPDTGVLFFATEGSVAVFEGPAEGYPRLGEMSPGEGVGITGRTASGWLRVTYNNQIGWVIARFGTIVGDQGAVPLAN